MSAATGPRPPGAAAPLVAPSSPTPGSRAALQEGRRVQALVEAERRLARRLAERAGLAPPAQDAPRPVVVACVDRLRRADEQEPAVRALGVEVDRLRWALALSVGDQLRWERRRRRCRAVGSAELAQAAALGLFEAARRFDPARGVRFGTYARFWIREAMGALLDELSHPVRLPRSARRELHRVAAVDTPRSRRRDLHRASVLGGLVEQVPLDGLRGDGRPWAELLGSDAPGPEERCERAQDLQALDRARVDADLDERQRLILTRRFESGHRPPSYREIGEELAVSGERVRQIEQVALGRLRRALAG